MITGINHITLSVKDLETSFAFYSQVLGFQAMAKWSHGAYFLAGELWVAIVEDQSTRMEKLAEYTHVAFSVPPEQFDELSARIVWSGAEIWQDNQSEGASLYFTDPNGHKLEIHASDLVTRLQTARAEPWEGLEFFV